MRPFLSLTAGILFIAVGALANLPATSTAAFLPMTGRVAQAPATTPAEQPALSSRRSVNLTEEDRHTIREIVLKDVNVGKTAAKVTAIGDPAPQDVVTYEFPPQVSSKISALQAHRFFVTTDDEIVIVDSRGGKIADIVKADTAK
jgi:hypothetical protein